LLAFEKVIAASLPASRDLQRGGQTRKGTPAEHVEKVSRQLLMRILFFSHYYPPEVNAPASRTSEHCQRWAAQGHDVTVVTCIPNCPTGVAFDGYRNRLRRQVERREGVEVVRVWTFLAPNAGTVRRILNYLSYLLSAVCAGLRVR